VPHESAPAKVMTISEEIAGSVSLSGSVPVYCSRLGSQGSHCAASGEMDPFISIITVSLNAEATIEDTIASVCYQRAGFGVEHICVDGGSSDATRPIIDRWVGRGTIPVRPIYETDKGIFDAMNKGLSIARGEYVLFLNADDFLVSPNALAAVMEGLAPGAKQNPDLIVGSASMGILGRYGIWRHRRVPSLLGRLRGWGLFPVHQGQFTKRRLLVDIGGFDTGANLASDLNLYYDLEYKMRPKIRIVRFDVAFMRAGGAANAGLKSMCKGSIEIFRHLSRTRNSARAVCMVLVKTLQSFSEIRFGRCPHDRWFSRAITQGNQRRVNE
jgi:glycosyltransferase involved in cell wall biosynthesis